ncbi:MFS transporter [Streptomyces montanisoli]|uniref:MFS transporter n=1 Tax=Streptomyces montanisoli TaxID=2798581 RepID=A0A940MFN0_9ACTN|nr:MFS transporter [Streptomyces montanisoli]MBP0458296.1 MFS transporter [Streptomyces montanisoli]
MAGTERTAHAAAHARGTVVALAVADISFAYQQTAVVPVIPDIEKAVHLSQTWGAWLLSGYLLVATVSTPLLGRLADRRGRRRMLLLGLVVFLAGSVGAACAPNAAVLIVFRALQGVGGAVFPLSLSIAREELPKERVGGATGTLTAAFGIGTALGFATSGALSSAVSWRLVFAVGAAMVALALPLVVRWVPSRPGPSSGAVDLRGAGLLGACLALLLVALTLAPQQSGAGWAVPGGLLAVSFLAGVAWLRHERRAPAPLVDLWTLRSPTEKWTNAITVGVGYALFGVYYLVPQFVQDPTHGFAAGTAVVGLFLLPAAVGQLLASAFATRIRGRGTTRRPLAAGMAALALGSAGFATLGRDSVPVFLAAGFVLGCGAGLAISATSTLASLGADEEHAAVATAVNSTVRRVGGGLGSQVSAGILVLTGRGTGSWVLAFAIAAAVCALCVVPAGRMPLKAGGSTREDS